MAAFKVVECPVYHNQHAEAKWGICLGNQKFCGTETKHLGVTRDREGGWFQETSTYWYLVPGI